MVEQVLVEDGVVDGVAVTDLAEVDGVAQQTVVGRPGRSTSCRSGCAARLSLSQFAITMAPETLVDVLGEDGLHYGGSWWTVRVLALVSGW